jgi:DDE superfamily endonuclease
MWCVAEINEPYIARMEDVLELYERPHNPQEPVVCFDEKPVTLHAEVRPRQAAQPGQIAKRDSEYKRCGTANTFCAVEPKAGRHFTWVSRKRTAAEFARVRESECEHQLRDESAITWRSQTMLARPADPRKYESRACPRRQLSESPLWNVRLHSLH